MIDKVIATLEQIGEEILHIGDDPTEADIKTLKENGIEFVPQEGGKAGGSLKKVSDPKDYFKPSEFACPCCGKGTVHLRLHKALNRARGIAGVPFVITSGYRCAKHNTTVGGSETSSHMARYAVDISAPNSTTRFKIVKGLVMAGFTRIGIGKNFIHADVDPKKDPEVIWLY